MAAVAVKVIPKSLLPAAVTPSLLLQPIHPSPPSSTSSPPASKLLPSSPTPKSQSQSTPQKNPLSPDSNSAVPLQSQTPTSLWKNLFTNSSPKSFPVPTYSEDGISIVQAPPEVILKASEAWKGYLLCTFFGSPPPPKKIYSDLNPIWGKNGDNTVRGFSEGSCLIFIPSIRTRQWVLDVGFWSAGTVAFSVSEWTSTSKLHSPHLSSAPLWLTFSEIPPQLWSPDGLRLIASGVRSPIPSQRLTLSSTTLGSAKIRAIVNLEKTLPPAVVVREEMVTPSASTLTMNVFPRSASCAPDSDTLLTAAPTLAAQIQSS